MIRFPLSPDEAAAAAYVVRLVGALTDAQGNIRAAAEALGMSEHTLRHRMKDLDLVTWNRKAHPLAGRQPRKYTTTLARVRQMATEGEAILVAAARFRDAWRPFESMSPEQFEVAAGDAARLALFDAELALVNAVDGRMTHGEPVDCVRPDCLHEPADSACVAADDDAPDSVDPRDLPPDSEEPAAPWMPMVGDRVRTADPLTATGYRRYRHRRAGACGNLDLMHLQGGWWVTHDDGTSAPYDTDELRPAPLTEEEGMPPSGREGMCEPIPEERDEQVEYEEKQEACTRGDVLPEDCLPWGEPATHIPEMAVTTGEAPSEPVERQCVSVLVTDAGDNVLLVKTDRGWELPGGKVEPGESLLGAAVRECEEETGITPDLSTASLSMIADATWIYEGGVPTTARATAKAGGSIRSVAWCRRSRVQWLALSDLPSRAVLLAWARKAVAP